MKFFVKKIVFAFSIFFCVSTCVDAQGILDSKKILDSLFVAKDYNKLIETFSNTKDVGKLTDNEVSLVARSIIYLDGESLSILPPIKRCNIPQLMAWAEVCYMSYKFDDCKDAIDHLTKLAARKRISLPYIESISDRLDRAKRLLGSTDKLDLISAKRYSIYDFTDGIQLSASTGRLYIMWEKDSIGDFYPIVTFTGERGIRRITTILENNKTHLQSQVLIDGAWHKSAISVDLLGSDDSSFPFMLEDGVTLYFAQRSKDGLGGYDISMSRLDIDNNRFLGPTSMGMPYNSAFNDYLLAEDAKSHLKYLVSDRMMPRDSVMVYTFRDKLAISTDLSEQERAKIAMIATKDTICNSDTIDDITDSESGYDIYFRITPQIVIKKWSDFRSKKARTLYLKSLEYKIQQQTIELALRHEIERYRKEENTALKNKIGETIEDYRERVRVIKQEYENTLLESKIEEIKTYFPIVSTTHYNK